MDRLAIELSSRLDEIPRLAELVEGFADSNDLPPQLAFKLNLSLEELVTNIVSYAYDDDEAHVIGIELKLADNMVTVEVEDDGKPFDPFKDAPTPDLDADLESRTVGGLGIHLVKTYMDEVGYQRAGDRNRVTLRLRADA